MVASRHGGGFPFSEQVVERTTKTHQASSVLVRELSSGVDFTASLSDSTTTSESASTTTLYARALTSAVTPAESASNLNVHTRALSDTTFGVTDSLQIYDIKGSSNLQRHGGAFPFTSFIHESKSGQTNTDILLSATAPPSSYTINIFDATAGTSDNLSFSTGYTRSIADSVTSAEARSKAQTLHLASSVTSSEAIAQHDYSVAIASSVTSSEAISPGGNFNITLRDATLPATDFSAVNYTNRSITATASVQTIIRVDMHRKIHAYPIITDSTANPPPAPPGPLTLTAGPSSQKITRVGPGAVSAVVGLTATGGVPPYTYTTAAAGLTVTNGASASPVISTILVLGQDTTTSVVSQVIDSVGTVATTTSTLQFTANAAAAPLSLSIAPSNQKVQIMGPGNASATLTFTPTGGLAPYTLSTSAPGLTVTGGNTTNPTLSVTLTAGQDTTYPITVTLTDSIGTPAATATAFIEFVAAAPDPLVLSISPSNQTFTRTGDGTGSVSVAYTVTGGIAPYTFTTDAPGLTVTNGTTATPTVSTTLTSGQDITYTLTGTVSDSVGTTPASATATVDFVANAPPPQLAISISPSTQQAIRRGPGPLTARPLTYSATGGTGPYTYTTTATPAGLTITGGDTATPTVSTTLTNGQDIVFTVTATVTDSLSATASSTALVEFKSNIPALVLTAAPSSQKITRVGAGVTPAASINYTASGGSGAYTYATSATPAGLTITGGNTATPSFTTTLTAGQDTTFTITGTLTDSIGTAPTTATATVEFAATATAPPLNITVAPATQTQSRVGSGSKSTTLNYTATGGSGIYAYTTTATPAGLTITGGNTATPTLTANLTAPQDTTYTVTATVSDNAGTTPASATATVEFVATAATTTQRDKTFQKLARGMVADGIASIATPGTWISSGWNYTETGVANDMAILKGMGITYLRVPVDISFIMPGIPQTWTGKTTATRTPATQTSCNSNWTWIDAQIDMLIRNGFFVVVCPFVDEIVRWDLQAGNNYIPGAPGDFQTTFNEATKLLPTRYAGKYTPDQIGFEIYNEPRFTQAGTNKGGAIYPNPTPNPIPAYDPNAYDLITNPDGTTTKKFFNYAYPNSDYTAYNAYHPQLTATIRAIAPNHTIISDTFQSAKSNFISNFIPSTDQNTIYAFHFYDPTVITQMGTPGNVMDAAGGPYHIYPRAATNPGASVDPFWSVEWDFSMVHAQMQVAVTWANGSTNTVSQGGNKLGVDVPIILGEFGTAEACQITARVNLMRDIRNIASSFSLNCYPNQGVPNCHWAWKEPTFGIRGHAQRSDSTRRIDLDTSSPTYLCDLDMLPVLTFPYT